MFSGCRDGATDDESCPLEKWGHLAWLAFSGDWEWKEIESSACEAATWCSWTVATGLTELVLESSRIVTTCLNITVTIMCVTLCLKFMTAPINHIFMWKSISLANDAGRPATTGCSVNWLFVGPFSVSSQEKNDFSDSFIGENISWSILKLLCLLLVFPKRMNTGALTEGNNNASRFCEKWKRALPATLVCQRLMWMYSTCWLKCACAQLILWIRVRAEAKAPPRGRPSGYKEVFSQSEWWMVMTRTHANKPVGGDASS